MTIELVMDEQEGEPKGEPLTNEQVIAKLEEAKVLIREAGLALADRGEAHYTAEEMSHEERKTALNGAYLTGIIAPVVVTLNAAIEDGRSLLGVPRPVPDLTEMLKALGVKFPTDEELERFENRENN